MSTLTAVILDKSYLQGCKAEELLRLAQTHRLIVSDALFYELLTTDPVARSRCFAKFPTGTNPVELFSHIGTMMRAEIDTHKASDLPSQHCHDFPFTFNPALVTPTYALPPEANVHIAAQTAQLRKDVVDFLERVKLIPDLFPKLLTGTTEERLFTRASAEATIVSPYGLLPFYSQLEPPPNESALPPAESITQDWALYRWLQIQLLFALDVYIRYQGVSPDLSKPKVYKRIEHDVLDFHVLNRPGF